tara:strand:- start:1581 stop:1826 length:246 start_codon:yes stop_codon:yes gene_type:complete
LAKAAVIVKRCFVIYLCGDVAILKLLTRIINVGNILGFCDIRLIEAASRKAFYTCLNHCWRGKQLLKAIKDNLLNYLQFIP